MSKLSLIRSFVCVMLLAGMQAVLSGVSAKGPLSARPANSRAAARAAGAPFQMTELMPVADSLSVPEAADPAAALPVSDRTHWSIGTNIVDYVDFGTLNLEGSVGVARHWTVNAGVKFNPWEFKVPNDQNVEGTEILRDRRFTASAGARFWPWYVYSGWWLGAKLQYEMYNRANFLGGWLSSMSYDPRRGWNTEEGHAFGLGISAGYTMMLHKNLNLDIGVGFWAGPTYYTVYQCPRCGKIIDPKPVPGQEVKPGVKPFVLPNDLQVSLVYIF